MRVGVRTGDTPAYERRSLRDHPPHILITTPESLSLLLSQESWQPLWSGLDHVIIDEVHALAPTKRGADLAVSLERLASYCARDPIRIGLSATCRRGRKRGSISGWAIALLPRRHGTAAARHTSDPDRRRDLDRARRSAPPRLELSPSVETPASVDLGNRTTVIFANTRAFAEKLTHDLRQDPQLSAGPEAVSSHITLPWTRSDGARSNRPFARERSGRSSPVRVSSSASISAPLI